MFKVLIALKEVFRTDSLAEACQVFIQKVNEMIKNGGCSALILYETCMIEGKVDGVTGIMNFDAISAFSFEIGILNDRGKLSGLPLPYIPRDLTKNVFLLNSEDSWNAFFAEQREMLKRIAANEFTMESEPEQPKSTIIVVPA